MDVGPVTILDVPALLGNNVFTSRRIIAACQSPLLLNVFGLGGR